jgi:hypothetical protein
VNLIAVGDGGPAPLLPRTKRRARRKPALPTPEELASLPGGARAALALRCAARVARLTQLRGDGNEVAATMLAACAILRAAPDPRAVAVIRRDFEVLKRLAREQQWTDDTAVPQEVFGPMWPDDRVPKWCRESNESRG